MINQLSVCTAEITCETLWCIQLQPCSKVYDVLEATSALHAGIYSDQRLQNSHKKIFQLPLVYNNRRHTKFNKFNITSPPHLDQHSLFWGLTDTRCRFAITCSLLGGERQLLHPKVHNHSAHSTLSSSTFAALLPLALEKPTMKHKSLHLGQQCVFVQVVICLAV